MRNVNALLEDRFPGLLPLTGENPFAAFNEQYARELLKPKNAALQSIVYGASLDMLSLGPLS